MAELVNYMMYDATNWSEYPKPTLCLVGIQLQLLQQAMICNSLAAGSHS
jgi:hypothetical protein